MTIGDPPYTKGGFDRGNNHQPNLEQIVSDIRSELRAYAVDIVKNHDTALGQRFEHVDKLLEVLQNQVGALTQGYLEVTALVQALMSHLMNDSPEKVEEFKVHVREARNTYMDTLKYAIRTAPNTADHFTALAPDNVEQHQGSEES